MERQRSGPSSGGLVKAKAGRLLDRFVNHFNIPRIKNTYIVCDCRFSRRWPYSLFGLR